MQPQSYPPNRRRGFTIISLLILLFVIILSLCIWRATSLGSGPGLVLWSLAGLVAALPIPFLLYRYYALVRSNYLLDRETLTLRWGLRLEQIPVNDVEWVRSADDLTHPLRLPIFSIPGAVLGMQSHPDLGTVEFMASDAASLLLVVTAHKVFAISPADPVAFSQDFQRTVEMGSLVPVAPQSVYPSFVLIQVWQDRLVRYLWLAGLALNLGLLVLVSWLIPGLKSVPLGFLTSGVPRNSVPGLQLFLLPIISILFFLISWLVGLYFYRRPPMRQLAFLTWGFSALAGFFFLLAVWFILSAST